MTVTVTPASGARVEGRLVRIDDFLVSLIQDDGHAANVRAKWRRTEDRTAAIPREAHRKLDPTLADKDMHNVTAYLWTTSSNH